MTTKTSKNSIEISSEQQKEFALHCIAMWPLQFYLFWWIVGFDLLFGENKKEV